MTVTLMVAVDLVVLLVLLAPVVAVAVAEVVTPELGLKILKILEQVFLKCHQYLNPLQMQALLTLRRRFEITNDLNLI